MALVILAVIVVNCVILYILFTRPDATRVQQMIDASIKPTGQIEASKLAEIAELVPTPSPVPIPSVIPGPKGDTVVGATGAAGAVGQSVVGPPGKDGKDGLSIIGEKGDPGAPGREVQLARDPDTGEMYMRYTGDTLWSLVDAP